MGDARPPISSFEPHWHSKPRPLRIICIGAGATGLLVAYKLQKLLENYELAIYEKNPEVGGTWYENRYPGCACDVPAHVYTYSFEPNPNWSKFYAESAEIQQYFEDFATKYNLKQYIHLNTKVVRAEWQEHAGTYQVQTETNGVTTRDWCHILINGTGNLNKWKWPDIPGLHSFKGDLLHSANWNPDTALEGKTVALIGTGSSAIQILPQIQPKVKRLLHFMRSVTWISPPWAEEALQKSQTYDNIDSSAAPPAAASQSQYTYTPADKARFRAHPDAHLSYRQDLEAQFNEMFEIFLRDSDASKRAQARMQAEMLRRLGPGHSSLKARLIPSWPPGCRRLTPGDGYLEALVQANVTPIHEEIARIQPDGLLVVDGKTGQLRLHRADAIVCATGFDVSFKPPFELRGVDGIDMAADAFEPEPYAYLGMAVPKFPNYFTVNGVRGSWAVGTALNSIEACLDYIVSCVRRVQSENIRALEVKMEPIRELYAYIDEWHERSVWGADCKSWYRNNIPGGRLWIWGGSALHYMKTLEFVRWEHYEFRYHRTAGAAAANPWAFLGNGQVKAEMTRDRDRRRLTPYIRNADTPWCID